MLQTLPRLGGPSHQPAHGCMLQLRVAITGRCCHLGLGDWMSAGGGMGLEGADGNVGTAGVGLKCHVIAVYASPNVAPLTR
jgi:hypothetical protein